MGSYLIREPTAQLLYAVIWISSEFSSKPSKSERRVFSNSSISRVSLVLSYFIGTVKPVLDFKVPWTIVSKSLLQIRISFRTSGFVMFSLERVCCWVFRSKIAEINSLI